MTEWIDPSDSLKQHDCNSGLQLGWVKATTPPA